MDQFLYHATERKTVTVHFLKTFSQFLDFENQGVLCLVFEDILGASKDLK